MVHPRLKLWVGLFKFIQAIAKVIYYFFKEKVFGIKPKASPRPPSQR